MFSTPGTEKIGLPTAWLLYHTSRYKYNFAWLFDKLGYFQIWTIFNQADVDKVLI